MIIALITLIIMTTLDSLSQFTPIRGRWFFDGPLEYSWLKIDLTDPSTFHPQLAYDLPAGYFEAVDKFRAPDPSSGNKSYNEYLVPNSDSYRIRLLRNILTLLRDHLATRFKLYKFINHSRYCTPWVTYERVPDSIVHKRQFFLYLARAVVFSNVDVNDWAKKWNINIRNLLIWVSTYLTHGPDVFFLKSRDMMPQVERFIAMEHHRLGGSYVLTGARHALLDNNRIKRILHRARLQQCGRLP